MKGVIAFLSHTGHMWSPGERLIHDHTKILNLGRIWYNSAVESYLTFRDIQVRESSVRSHNNTLKLVGVRNNTMCSCPVSNVLKVLINLGNSSQKVIFSKVCVKLEIISIKMTMTPDAKGNVVDEQ
uniref:Uncharacterized protein n=1 Tax=Cacopsylla melanoneura TaxID=428564 RepID=A0A8D8X0Z0_9HEMI